MKKLLLFCVLLFSLNWLVVHAHSARTLPATSPEYKVKEALPLSQNNLLASVKIELDRGHNRINFKTPQILQNVNITIKHAGDRVLLQQHNMTIHKNYSITFPAPAEGGPYTVILQQDNQIVVKRLN